MEMMMMRLLVNSLVLRGGDCIEIDEEDQQNIIMRQRKRWSDGIKEGRGEHYLRSCNHRTHNIHNHFSMVRKVEGNEMNIFLVRLDTYFTLNKITLDFFISQLSSWKLPMVSRVNYVFHISDKFKKFIFTLDLNSNFSFSFFLFNMSNQQKAQSFWLLTY